MVGNIVDIDKRLKLWGEYTKTKSDFASVSSGSSYRCTFYSEYQTSNFMNLIKNSTVTIITLSIRRPSVSWYHRFHPFPPMFIFGGEPEATQGVTTEGLNEFFTAGASTVSAYQRFTAEYNSGYGGTWGIYLFATPDGYTGLQDDDSFIVRVYTLS